MNRYVVHDSERARLVVEVQIGLVTLSLFFGTAPNTMSMPQGFSSHAAVSLSPGDARDRLTLFRAIDGLELVAYGKIMQPERRVPLDVIHRSIMDITRRPSA